MTVSSRAMKGEGQRHLTGSCLVCLGLQIPLSQQVEHLVGQGQYEEAIAICSMFEDSSVVGEDRALLADIDCE